MKKQVLVIIGGLDDERMIVWPVSWLWGFWERAYGIKVVPYYMFWHKTSVEAFERKIMDAVALVKGLKSEGYSVSLLGMSAGASAAFNAYYQCKDQVDSLINCCGRLRKGGPEIRIRTLDLAAAGSPLFRKSVLSCEEGLSSLGPNDLAKILTLRAALDEIVPAQTSVVPGARNVLLPTIEHTTSIILSMTVFSKLVANFMRRSWRV